MVQHPWPLLEISLSDFRRLATLNMITYLPTYFCAIEMYLNQENSVQDYRIEAPLKQRFDVVRIRIRLRSRDARTF